MPRCRTILLIALLAVSPAMADTWWSLKPLTRPPVPETKTKPKNPIDAFIETGLEAKGLTPSPEADRVTLIRRLSYDLLGLPPTPAEIDEFVNDKTPDAYLQLVRRMLASPRYGERWGRHWLDVVHYGDTHGYDKDKRRDHAWPYRDYVIRAFNSDKPYDRFVREQLAGDVLYPNDPDGTIATGFVVAGPWDFVGQVELREGTVDKEKTRAIDRDDMVANTVSTFMSLTAHCARCHNHKFDPIPTSDYYRLQAVFAGVERGDRTYPSPGSAERIALEKRLGEVLPLQAAIEKRIAALSSPEMTVIDSELKQVSEALSGFPALPIAVPSRTNGYHSGIEHSADTPKWVQIDLGRDVPIERIRLVPARPIDFPDTPGFGFPRRFTVQISNDPEFHTSQTVADHSTSDFPNPGDEPVVVAVDRPARYVRVTAHSLWLRTNDYVFALAELEVISHGKNIALGAPVTALDSIEAGFWSKRNLVDGFSSRVKLPEKENNRRDELQSRQRTLNQQRAKAADALLNDATRKEREQLVAERNDIDAKLRALPPSPQVYAVVPRPPRSIHVLNRGDVEKPGDLASPGALTCVRGPDPDFESVGSDEGLRRAALANWIADSRNPLTWRSMANRIWHYHFGKGLVDTPNDFGKNGSKPINSELLDWLACELRDQGSLKHLHELIVTSRTYQQQSLNRPEATKVDSDNRLLWRMNRERLDAESIRDAVLAVSGKLDLRMGGPGFELFRFKDDHSPIYDHSDTSKSDRPETWRRTVYRFTVRSVPNPFLESLDCADPSINTPVRNTTLTALQALALLNDPFMLRQSEYFANRLRSATTKPADQIATAYRLALGRSPTADESAALIAYAAQYGLPNACRLIFNLNEFSFID
jgi:uncharacterized protein DUF1553/uncharacterized protein DUF1549/F5/8 type C domain-containing protein